MSEREPAKGESTERPLQTLARTLRLALIIVFALVVTLGLWAWLSAGSDEKLPFGYGSFG